MIQQNNPNSNLLLFIGAILPIKSRGMLKQMIFPKNIIWNPIGKFERINIFFHVIIPFNYFDPRFVRVIPKIK
jgi:hypothetical protein